MPRTALVILANGFEEIEAVTSIDILRRADVRVTVAAVACVRVDGAHGVPFVADVTLADVKDQDFDAVVLPGGMPGAQVLGGTDMVREVVTRHADDGRIVAGICAAPAMALAAFGVLDGKRATCYPGFEERFPDTATFVEDAVVVDGNVTTSRGPGTAFAFGLELARQLAGEQKANELAAAMQYAR